MSFLNWKEDGKCRRTFVRSISFTCENGITTFRSWIAIKPESPPLTFKQFCYFSTGLDCFLSYRHWHLTDIHKKSIGWWMDGLEDNKRLKWLVFLFVEGRRDDNDNSPPSHSPTLNKKFAQCPGSIISIFTFSCWNFFFARYLPTVRRNKETKKQKSPNVFPLGQSDDDDEVP
jgi:hypothetical protein